LIERATTRRKKTFVDGCATEGKRTLLKNIPKMGEKEEVQGVQSKSTQSEDFGPFSLGRKKEK